MMKRKSTIIEQQMKKKWLAFFVKTAKSVSLCDLLTNTIDSSREKQILTIIIN